MSHSLNPSTTHPPPTLSPRHITFSVSAGSFPYQMGVAKYLQENFNLENIHFSGASGGSWAALLLAAGIDMSYALNVLLSIAPDCCKDRLFGAYFVYDLGVRDVFNHIFEGIDLSKTLEGKLAISVTRIDLNHLFIPCLRDEIITKFYSNDDVVDCIIASALIPFILNGKPFVNYRNWICVDAGLTNVAGVRRFIGTSATAEEIFFDKFSKKNSKNGNQEWSIKKLTKLSTYWSKLFTESLVSTTSSVASSMLLLGSNCITKFIDRNFIKYLRNNSNENEVNEEIKASSTLAYTNPSLRKLYTYSDHAHNRARADSRDSDNVSITSFRSDLTVLPKADKPYGLIKLGIMSTAAVSSHVIASIKSEVTDALENMTDKLVPEIMSNTLGKCINLLPLKFQESLLNKMPLVLRKRITNKNGSLDTICNSSNDNAVVNTDTILATATSHDVVPSTSTIDATHVPSQAKVTYAAIHDIVNHSPANTIPSTPVIVSINKHTSDSDSTHWYDTLLTVMSKLSSPLADAVSSDSDSDSESRCDSQDDTDTDENYVLNEVYYDMDEVNMDESIKSDIENVNTPSKYTWKSAPSIAPTPARRNPGRPFGTPLRTNHHTNHGNNNNSNTTTTTNNNNSTSCSGNNNSNSTIGGVSNNVPAPVHIHHESGVYWNSKPNIIKKLEHGGLLLEIAPWSFRRQPLLHYHLTGDPQQVQKLFDLGYHDAKNHHRTIAKFFKRKGSEVST